MRRQNTPQNRTIEINTKKKERKKNAMTLSVVVLKRLQSFDDYSSLHRSAINIDLGASYHIGSQIHSR